MAKGARSSKKKQLHTWRRENLTAEWTGKAEERKQEALQQILQAPKPLPEGAAAMQEEPQRGREGAAGHGGDMDMGDEDGASKGGSKKKGSRFSKGVKVAGVHKKKRAGKAFLQGAAVRLRNHSMVHEISCILLHTLRNNGQILTPPKSAFYHCSGLVVS